MASASASANLHCECMCVALKKLHVKNKNKKKQKKQLIVLLTAHFFLFVSLPCCCFVYFFLHRAGFVVFVSCRLVWLFSSLFSRARNGSCSVTLGAGLLFTRLNYRFAVCIRRRRCAWFFFAHWLRACTLLVRKSLETHEALAEYKNIMIILALRTSECSAAISVFMWLLSDLKTRQPSITQHTMHEQN